MVSLVKHWREAASVIVAAKSGVGHILSQSQVSAARRKLMCDYKILLLRRSGNMKFFANSYVYPGGVVSNADFSDNWAKMFQNCSTDVTKLGKKMEGSVRSQLMSRIHQSVIPNEIGFRICAIREAFEESGILLARDINAVKQDAPLLGKEIHIYDKKEAKSLLELWRGKVHNDATQFIELCKELSIVPDVWGLIEWSDWLTPCFLPPPGKRFDTVFFLCATDTCGSQVDVTHDEKETTMIQWCSPDESLTLFGEQKMKFGPPQLYEMARLCRYNKLEDLVQHAVGRAPQGCEQWLPVRIEFEDGNIALMPGDSLYPAEPDVIGEHPYPTATGSYQSRQEQDRFLNRFEFQTMTLVSNLPSLSLNQTAPLGTNDLKVLFSHMKPKL
ncbi:acyl-coenzyme A diphosphatase NUDT19-like [Lineus longissimus]|uniref:acyl-coenzyme A diphosphatase NUDT19-like n=1 Tax=Lineus longissimus TaxID=88925 RepID=UPI00315CE455